MKPPKKKNTYKFPIILRIVANIMIGTGIICLFRGWQHYREFQNFIGNKIATRGTIVKIPKNISHPSFYVQFKTRNGYDIVFGAEPEITTKDTLKYSVGEQVRVFYNPDDPYNAFVYQDTQKEFKYMGLFTLGGGLMLQGVIFLLVALAQAKKVKKK